MHTSMQALLVAGCSSFIFSFFQSFDVKQIKKQEPFQEPHLSFSRFRVLLLTLCSG